MPTWGDYYVDNSAAAMREAVRQVRAKFPRLMEGSSGWRRAVKNRFTRLRG